MEMILMGACVSLFGLVVTCLAFAAATRQKTEPSSNRDDSKRLTEQHSGPPLLSETSNDHTDSPQGVAQRWKK
jgi:hypothetical protein